MHLEYLPTRLQKPGLHFDLSGPASTQEILSAERRLNASFPDRVRQFYEHYNGLRVLDPHLEILPVAMLTLTSPERLHFATVDINHRIFFDPSRPNVAGQWDIRSEDGFLVTLTMSSFWSNKIWGWLERGERIT